MLWKRDPGIYCNDFTVLRNCAQAGKDRCWNGENTGTRRNGKLKLPTELSLISNCKKSLIVVCLTIDTYAWIRNVRNVNYCILLDTVMWLIMIQRDHRLLGNVYDFIIYYTIFLHASQIRNLAYPTDKFKRFGIVNLDSILLVFDTLGAENYFCRFKSKVVGVAWKLMPLSIFFGIPAMQLRN